MNLLLLVQRFCKRTNLDVPNTVLGTTDPQIKQILGLLEEEGNDLAGRGDWQELTNEATHTSLAQENQGAIKTIASNGFRYIKNGTLWNRTDNDLIYVIDGTDWQQLQATASTGPSTQVRIRGGNLIAYPTPTAGDTWAFEYITYNWITDSAGANPDQYFTADTDLMLLPENILMMGLRWRWKKEKGLEYAEDFRSYEILVKDALTRSGMNRTLNMSDRPSTPNPKVVIPEGSWGL